MSDVGSPVFVATVIGKNGKMSFTNEMEVSAEEMRLGEDASPHPERGGAGGASRGARAYPGSIRARSTTSIHSASGSSAMRRSLPSSWSQSGSYSKIS